MRCTLQIAGDVVQRLEAFALGDNPDDMSDCEVAASLSLLDLLLPDLAEVAVEMAVCARHVH